MAATQDLVGGQVLGGADHEGGLRVGHHVVDLGLPHGVVDRGRDRSGPAGRQAQQQLVVAVPGGHHHDLAGLGALRHRRRPPVDPVGRLGQGATRAPDLVHQHPVGVGRSQAVQQVAEEEVAVEGQTSPADGAQHVDHHGRARYPHPPTGDGPGAVYWAGSGRRESRPSPRP